LRSTRRTADDVIIATISRKKPIAVTLLRKQNKKTGDGSAVPLNRIIGKLFKKDFHNIMLKVV
jgi:hypothetical protein